MSDHVITKGLDIPIIGGATGDVVALDPPSTVAYAPTELRGITAKPSLREGAEVKRGTPLFFHKADPRLVFRSPVAGVVREIRRGRRRVITDVVVERASDEAETGQSHSLQEIRKLSREDALSAALASGMWAAFQTRPLDRVPSPDDVPQSIFVVATETGPLQPGASVLLGETDAEGLRAGIELVRQLCPRIHVTRPAGFKHEVLDSIDGVERHTFSGPHPSGDPGVQVNHVDPPKGGGQVWTIRAWDLALMGTAVLTGEFPAERVYAAIGAGVKEPRFVRTLLGAPLKHIAGEVAEGDQRWIRGSVLTGEAVDHDRWASFRARAVHVLPAAVPREVLGWALPMFATWSFHRSFVSGLTGSRPSGGVDMRPGLFGGKRAIVPIGAYERVVATPDILPEFLFKSLFAGDLEESIQLGMLDLTNEEAALCTYVCPSKLEFDVLLREGLDMYEKEA